MTSVAEKKRRKRAIKAKGRVSPSGKADHTTLAATVIQDRQSNRPTPERMSRGKWAEPQGPKKSDQPIVDTQADMIAVLHAQGQISDGQEQAARHFQALRTAYLAELPDVKGYRSCIDPSVPGFDDGDGDPAVIAEYRGLERKLSYPQRRELLAVCESDQMRCNNEILRQALDVVGS